MPLCSEQSVISVACSKPRCNASYRNDFWLAQYSLPIFRLPWFWLLLNVKISILYERCPLCECFCTVVSLCLRSVMLRDYGGAAAFWHLGFVVFYHVLVTLSGLPTFQSLCSLWTTFWSTLYFFNTMFVRRNLLKFQSYSRLATYWPSATRCQEYNYPCWLLVCCWYNPYTEEWQGFLQ